MPLILWFGPHRLGNNLLVGALFTQAAELIGVEMNPFFAGLSRQLVVDWREHIWAPPANADNQCRCC